MMYASLLNAANARNGSSMNDSHHSQSKNGDNRTCNKRCGCVAPGHARNELHFLPRPSVLHPSVPHSLSRGPFPHLKRVGGGRRPSVSPNVSHGAHRRDPRLPHPRHRHLRRKGGHRVNSEYCSFLKQYFLVLLVPNSLSGVGKMQKIFMPTAVLPISQYDIICTPMPTNRLRARPDPMLSRMVRAAHPVFTRMVRRSPLSSSFSRMVRKPNYLRMVPAAFREEPLETGILSHTHQLQVPGEGGGGQH